MASSAHVEFQIGDIVVLAESIYLPFGRIIEAGEGGVIVDIDREAAVKLSVRLSRQFRSLRARGNMITTDAHQLALAARAWR